MTIIELLNKEANGEETPKKFKYDGLTFIETESGRYEDEDGDNLTKSICWDYSNLNDEVEIIEEDKKIEKIMWSSTDYFKQEIIDKINEIIDNINKGENK